MKPPKSSARRTRAPHLRLAREGDPPGVRCSLCGGTDHDPAAHRSVRAALIQAFRAYEAHDRELAEAWLAVGRVLVARDLGGRR